MSLARDVVELAERLASNPDAPDLFAREPDLARHPETATMLTRLGPLAAGNPEPVLQLLLQALRIQQSLFEPKLIDAAFVATFPGETPTGALPTKQVIRDMLRAPASEVIALGYEFSAKDVIELLRKQSAAGADVTIICDRQQTGIAELRAQWAGSQEPKIYSDQPREGSSPYAKMHCKALLVDRNDLLITSANFTFHGLEGNIEFGVRIRGQQAAGARRVFDHMIQCGLVSRM